MLLYSHEKDLTAEAEHNKTRLNKERHKHFVNEKHMKFYQICCFSYVFSAFQDYPVLVLSHFFLYTLFFYSITLNFISFCSEEEKMDVVSFIFPNRKSPLSFFSAPSGHKPRNSCLFVQMRVSISICLLQSRLLSSDIDLILYLYIPRVAFLQY